MNNIVKFRGLLLIPFLLTGAFASSDSALDHRMQTSKGFLKKPLNVKSDSLVRSPIIKTQSDAVKMGYSICEFFLGKKIKKMKPYHAVAEGDSAWHVYGTALKLRPGGEPHIRFNKYDLRIYEIYMTK